MTENACNKKHGVNKRFRNDAILVAALLLLSLVILLLFRAFSRVGDHAVVSLDGRAVMRLSLAEDCERTITSYNGGYNTVAVKDGSVFVSDASCPDGICVEHRPISSTNESIICLPNRLTVCVVSGDNEPDVFT